MGSLTPDAAPQLRSQSHLACWPFGMEGCVGSVVVGIVVIVSVE